MKASDLITWTNSAAALREHLALEAGDTSHDVQLRAWLEAGAQLADEYLGREDFEAVPNAVRLGVFELVRARHQARDQADGLASAGYDGRSEAFAVPGHAARATRVAESLWYPHCARPWEKRAPA